MQTPAVSSCARRRNLAALLFAVTLVTAPPTRGQDLVVDNGATDTVTATQGSGIYDNIIVGNSGGGTVNQSGGNLFAEGNFEMGVGSLSSATYNLSGGTLTVQGQALIGIAAFEVNFKQSGGSFTVDGNLLQIGGSRGDNAFYTLTGGSLSANQIQVQGEVDQSAGTVTTNAHALLIGTIASTFSFYNLTGGTLTVGSIGTGNSSAVSTINWNGGTIQAAASTTSFFQGLTYTRVRNNGATFDTNGFDVTVAQALIHSTLQGDAATDGGLTKIGAGTLTLSGANTYNGATNINGGTLQLLAGGSISSSGNPLSLAAGTSLNIAGGSVSLGTADGGDLLVGTTTNNHASTTAFLSTGSSLGTVNGYVGFAPGSNGSFSQSGGTYTVADYLFVAYDPNATGTSAPPTGGYTLSSGQLSTGTTQVGNGGTGTFTQTGGKQTVSGFLYLGLNGGSGTYNLGPGSTLFTNTTFVGYSGANGNTGSGMFFQTGGAATNTNGLMIGANAGSSGTYTLSVGTLMTNGILVGNQGNGLFTQSSGSVQSANNVVLGNDDGSGTSVGTGTYNLSGGTLSTPYLLIGQTAAPAGSAFTQSGGICTVNGAVLFGYQVANSVGTYNLNGGTLTANQIVRNAGSATFDFNGGTLQAGASSASFLQGLTAANVRNGGASIDTNGYSDTITQPLIHSSISGDAATDGGLTKLGAGVLTLLGANTYDGGTAVSAGTLQIGNGGAGGTLGGGNVTDNGALVFNRAGNVGVAATINGSGSLTQNGPGSITLTAANGYSGGTTVNAGAFIINNASGSATGGGSVTVNSSATLAGNGTISGTVSVNSGAFLQPQINGPGILRIGNASLTTSSLFLAGTLSIQLGGAAPGSGGYGQIITATGATIGGNLTLTLANGFVPTPGEQFYIIDDTSTDPTLRSTGAFANAPGGLIMDNAGDTYDIIYAGLRDPNNPSSLPFDVSLIAVNVVPEPTAWTLVVSGSCVGGGLLALRRRRDWSRSTQG